MCGWVCGCVCVCMVVCLIAITPNESPRSTDIQVLALFQIISDSTQLVAPLKESIYYQLTPQQSHTVGTVCSAVQYSTIQYNTVQVQV